MALWAACLFHIFPALCLGLLPGTCLSLQTGRPRSPTFEQMGSWMAPNGCPLSVFWNQYCLKLFSFFLFFPLFTSSRQRFHSTPYHPCRTLSWKFTDQNGFQCYETTARCCHFASRALLPSDLTDLLWQGVNLTRQGDCSLESCWFSPRQSSEVLHKLKTNTFFLRSQYTYCNTIPLHTDTKVSLLLDVTSKPQWLRNGVCVTEKRLPTQSPSELSGERIHLQCRRHSRHMLDHWIGKRCWRKKWQPTPVFLPKSHGQRSLEGYSPRSYKESALTD